MRFDPETFVTECRDALADKSPQLAVREIVERAVSDAAAVERAFGVADNWRIDVLYNDDDLTIMHFVWPPSVDLFPHEHRMWSTTRRRDPRARSGARRDVPPSRSRCPPRERPLRRCRLPRYAPAVVAGRAGDDRAAVLVAEGDRILGDHEWLRQLGRRLVSAAAITDGWGEPAAWLRRALAYFDVRGEEVNASACRSLLRRAGVAVPRRRGDETVPPDLRAMGVTSRELKVLRLLAEGASNKDIASRLYLSPRTVQRHVVNFSVKTAAASRSEMVAFAARTLRTADDG